MNKKHVAASFATEVKYYCQNNISSINTGSPMNEILEALNNYQLILNTFVFSIHSYFLDQIGTRHGVISYDPMASTYLIS